MRADLHIHTTASDGIFPPEAIVAMAKEHNLNVIAVTDHDTTSGISGAQAAANDLQITFIPGVEISAGGDLEIHVLGYGINPDAKSLKTLFSAMQDERIMRTKAILQRLEQLGCPLDSEAVFASAMGVVGRPHIARAMVEKGYVPTVQDAFRKYLSKGKPAFVSREKLDTAHVIRILTEAGGVPVLAHPTLLNMPQEHLLPLLSQWKDAGLMGIEVYHPTQRGAFDSWRRLADRFGFLITGGSDYHAPDRADGPLGGVAADWQTAENDIQHLQTLIGHALQ
ncbi:MAG: PHP domain-containing protein [Clostridia bacterium]|nr:PHP domain-containing protein [Clostridia bacterium]